MLRNKLLLLGIIILAITLRLVNFASNPPAIYWEEAALGYDAYSLLKTGKDHHGHTLPLVALESFGDWKPPLYAYAIIPFIPVFGLSEVAVRIPSLLAGLSLLVAIYLLAKKLGQNPIIVLAITAISPWAIQFSRVAWEAHLATALIVWGVYFGVSSVAKNGKLQFKKIITAVLFLVLSLYTYHAAKIVAPFVGVALMLFIGRVLGLTKILHHEWKKLLFVIAIAFTALLPIILKLNSSQVLQRSRETSIFSDVSLIVLSNSLKQQAGNSLVSRLVYHRYVLFAREIVRNMLAHLSPQYLFISGDSQLRHSVQFFGHLYHIEILFLSWGFFVWLKKRNRLQTLLLFVAFISLIPAAISTGSPHALRSMTIFPIFMLIVAQGIQALLDWAKVKRILFSLIITVIVFAYSVELISFWTYYNTIYPKVSAQDWQYGYKQMVAELDQTMKKYPSLPVYVSRAMGRPAMYYWFFTKTDPRLVQTENISVKKDQGEYLEFGNMYFINSESELPQDGSRLIIAMPNVTRSDWQIEVR